eukprot:sb/3462331/
MIMSGWGGQTQCTMTTVESLLSWDSHKLDQITGESGEVAKIVNVFREFLLTVVDERQRFSDERGVWIQQVKVAEVNAEQRCSELQNQLFDLTSRLRREASKKDDAERRQESTETTLSELRQKIEKLTGEKAESAAAVTQMEVDMNNLKVKLEDAMRRLQFKDTELKRMAQDWEGLTVKEASLSKLQAETRSKLSDVKNRENSLQFREERITQEKDLVTEQTKWLTEELSSKTEELSKLRQSTTESICRLKSELAEKSEEVAFLSASQASLKEQCGKLEKRVEELVEKLSDRDTRHNTEVENLREQLNKQERLAELYNNNNEEYRVSLYLNPFLSKFGNISTMTTVESLLSWDSHKLDQITGESGEVAKIVNVFREFLLTVVDERQRFSDERGVWIQQVKVCCAQALDIGVAEVNAEQRCNDAERRQESTETTLSELRQKIEKLTGEKAESAAAVTQMEVDMNNLKVKLEDAMRRLQFKDTELKRMAQDWEGLTVKEAFLSKLQAETRSKLSDVKNRENSLQFREERITQEKDLVTEQTKWLTEELSSKTEELSKLRQSTTESICRLKSELAEKSEEVAFLSIKPVPNKITSTQTSQASLKEQSSKLEKRVEELVEKLSDRDTRHNTEVENLREQLNKQERLAELYNNNNEEYRIKPVPNKITSTQTSQASLKEQSSKLEKRVEELVEKLSDRDTRHNTEVENLREQLNKQERLAELYNNNNEEYRCLNIPFNLVQDKGTDRGHRGHAGPIETGPGGKFNTGGAL